MSLAEIDARHRGTLVEAVGDEWDDPEDVEDDDEIGFRDADEEESFDEAGDQGDDA